MPDPRERVKAIVCADCGAPIYLGQRYAYGEDGTFRHAQHPVVEMPTVPLFPESTCPACGTPEGEPDAVALSGLAFFVCDCERTWSRQLSQAEIARRDFEHRYGERAKHG